MRHMSFMLTTAQVRARTKDVTRRLGWKFAKAGDVYCAIEKGRGLKKGEKAVPICPIRVKSTRWEPLSDITQDDVVREGFPDMTPAEFVAMFCRHNACASRILVNRIEFEYA